MMDYYKIYPKFSKFAEALDRLNLSHSTDVRSNTRTRIYNRLRLPITYFHGDTEARVQKLIKKYFGFENNYTFSIIESDSTSQIHTDTYYKKEAHLQRYCNLAFPLKGNFDDRRTVWPNLYKQDKLFVFKNSYLSDDRSSKYMTENSWSDSIRHKRYQPVLLNTAEAHYATGNGSTLFAYITIENKSYYDCVALYDAISNSATI